jgi:hypothetical protein
MILTAAFRLLTSEVSEQNCNLNCSFNHLNTFKTLLDQNSRFHKEDAVSTSYFNQIQGLMRIMNVSWLMACEIYHANRFNVVESIDSYFSSASSSSLSSYVVGFDLVKRSGADTEMQKASSWLCFSCHRSIHPSKMIGLTVCGHFACDDCWKKYLVDEISFYSDKKEDQIEKEINPNLVRSKLKCFRGEFDSGCKCFATVPLELIAYLTENNVETATRFGGLFSKIFR